MRTGRQRFKSCMCPYGRATSIAVKYGDSHDTADLGQGIGCGNQQHHIGLANADAGPRGHLRVSLQQYEPVTATN